MERKINPGNVIYDHWIRARYGVKNVWILIKLLYFRMVRHPCTSPALGATWTASGTFSTPEPRSTFPTMRPSAATRPCTWPSWGTTPTWPCCCFTLALTLTWWASFWNWGKFKNLNLPQDPVPWSLCTYQWDWILFCSAGLPLAITRWVFSSLSTFLSSAPLINHSKVDHFS